MLRLTINSFYYSSNSHSTLDFFAFHRRRGKYNPAFGEKQHNKDLVI
jgi:hypothetical protein